MREVSRWWCGGGRSIALEMSLVSNASALCSTRIDPLENSRKLSATRRSEGAPVNIERLIRWTRRA
jgi:hypothetical protein